MGLNIECRSVDDVVSNWPVAYAEVPGVCIKLSDHLVKTAELINILFKNKLLFLDKLYENMREYFTSISEIAYTAALLHDLGKASVTYLDKFRREMRSKVSFSLHEYVVSVILLNAAYRVTEEEDSDWLRKRNTLSLIAKIIARHHTAQKNRHPYEISSRKIDINVLKGLCREDSKIHDLLIELKNKCIGPSCKEVIDSVKDELLKILSDKQIENYASAHLRDICLFNLTGISDKQVFDIYKIVSAITGFLIIADNLVASYCEKRVSDDESTPVYVEYWVKELINKLKNNVLSSNSELSECFKGIKSDSLVSQ
ncbi:MAG: CRISPR-associated endonuclease Cas3'' [Desulfurococcaceae archaeon]